MKALQFIVLVLGLACLAVPAQAAEPAGFVAAVRAPAHLERAGERVEVRIGLQVQQGDVLATGPKGRLKVLLSDDSVVSLGTSSRVELSRHRFAPRAGERSTRLRVTGGLVRALVQKVVSNTAADFEARTQTAVAGVRGTEFALQVADPSGQPRLVTFSGSVDWSTDGGEPVLVAAGQGAGLVDGRPSPVEAVASAELTSLREATDAVQAPTALAWNLAPSERIRPGGDWATRSDLDQEPTDGQSDTKNAGPVEMDFAAGRDESLSEDDYQDWDGAVGGRPNGGGMGGGQDRYEGSGVLPADMNDPNELPEGGWSASFQGEPGFGGIPLRLDVTVVRNR